MQQACTSQGGCPKAAPAGCCLLEPHRSPLHPWATQQATALREEAKRQAEAEEARGAAMADELQRLKARAVEAWAAVEEMLAGTRRVQRLQAGGEP